MTTEERTTYRRQIEECQRQREAEERRRKMEAAARARTIWEQATPAPADHPYLQRKQVQPHGLRIDADNRLIVPVLLKGTLTSLQFIETGGSKKFLPGGEMKGGAFTLGDPTEHTILICEGFATAASVYEATGFPVVVTLSAGNLLPVAQACRANNPTLTILICGDNDKSGIGQQKAEEAAAAVNGMIVIPNVAGEDWNDVHTRCGLEAVKQAILRMSEQKPSPHSTPVKNAAHLHTPPALAHDPNILARFEDAVRVCGVVGEERCAKLVYLGLTSRVLSEPVSLAVKGLSSSGKSFTTDTTLKFFPKDSYLAMTAMSERALIYMKEEFAHKTLVIYEAVALKEQREKSDSNLTAYFVRSLLSEGRINYPVTVRDKEGGFITKTIVKEGPTNVILTTTATELHGENETRLLSIPTNDSQEQTKAVMVQLAGGRPQNLDFSPWHALQTWLATAEHRVAIPYAAYLAESIPPMAVRLRRDFKALLRLIEAHAILHQCSRQRDDSGRIIATAEDYLPVRALIADLIASGVGATVPETMRATVQAVQHLDLGEGVRVLQLAKELKLDRSAAQRRVQAARERGYLTNLEEKRGKPSRYAIGEPLPEERDLLPRDVPKQGCAPCAEPVHDPLHSTSAEFAKDNGEPVQVCNEKAREKEGNPPEAENEAMLLFSEED